MHLDVLRFVLSKYKSDTINRSCLLGMASETESLTVVQELIDIYRDKPATEPFTMSLLLSHKAQLLGEETEIQRLVDRNNKAVEDFKAILGRELPKQPLSPQ